MSGWMDGWSASSGWSIVWSNSFSMFELGMFPIDLYRSGQRSQCTHIAVHGHARLIALACATACAPQKDWHRQESNLVRSCFRAECSRYTTAPFDGNETRFLRTFSAGESRYHDWVPGS